MKRKAHPGEWGRAQAVPRASPNNGMGSNIVCFWNQVPSPDTHTSGGSSMRPNKERVARALASIFGNLLVPGALPL